MEKTTDVNCDWTRNTFWRGRINSIEKKNIVPNISKAAASLVETYCSVYSPILFALKRLTDCKEGCSLHDIVCYAPAPLRHVSKHFAIAIGGKAECDGQEEGKKWLT